MAKKKEIICGTTYTEGCGDRLTEALLDIYYARKKYGTETKKKKEDEKEGTV